MLATFERGTAIVLNSVTRKSEDWKFFIDQIFQKIMSMWKFKRLPKIEVSFYGRFRAKDLKICLLG